MSSNRIFKTRGFTLMELVVSMGLFLFVLSISMGALLKTVDASRKAETMRISMDNLNLAVEEMARSIRQGYSYHCGAAVGVNAIDERQDCPGGETYFAFEPHYGSTASSLDQVAYRLSGTTIEKTTDAGAVSPTWYPITSPNIEVNRLTFYQRGRGGRGEEAPLLVMVLSGAAGSGTEYASEFTIQTSVTQRALR